MERKELQIFTVKNTEETEGMKFTKEMDERNLIDVIKIMSDIKRKQK